MNAVTTVPPLSADASKISFTVEVVTPDVALAYLKQSKGNRSISEVSVGKYMTDMHASQFFLNGESIKFDWDGTLIDGHHRLVSVIKSGLPIEIVVARGINPAVARSLDNGRTRSPADHVTMNHGVVGAVPKLAIARQLIATERGLTRANRVGSIPIQDHYFSKREEIDEAYRVGIRARDKMKANVKVVATAYARFAEVDKSAAEQFFNGLISGAGLPEKSPILAARNYLLADRRSGGWQSRQIETLFRAWNFWRINEERQIIRLQDALPELV